MEMRKLEGLVACIALLALGGCVSSQEIPLSANTYRLEVSGSGRIGAGNVPNQVLKKAAALTVSKGYTHFVLIDADTQTGRTFAGYSSVGPMLATTRSSAVTVVMYRPGQNANALEAATILGT